MTYPIESIFQRLDKQLSGRLSRPGDKRYAAATAIWAKPVGPMPRALPKLDSQSIDVFIWAMASAASPGCAIITHEFRGAASRVPAAATAFGLRRDHVLVEILASFTDRSEPRDEHWHQRWAQATRRAFDAMALPGDTRTSSPAARWSARQRATAAMPSDSSRPSCTTIPTISSTQPFRCRPVSASWPPNRRAGQGQEDMGCNSPPTTPSFPTP